MKNNNYIIKYKKITPYIYLFISIILFFICFKKEIRNNIYTLPILILFVILGVISLFKYIRIMKAHKIYLKITDTTLLFPVKKICILKENIIDMKIILKNTPTTEFVEYYSFLEINYIEYVRGKKRNKKVLIPKNLCDIKFNELKKIILN